MKLLTSAVVASLVLGACQNEENVSSQKNEEGRLVDLRSDLRKEILMPAIDTIEARQIVPGLETYIDGSLEKEQKVLKEAATLLGDLMLKTYIAENSPVNSQTNLNEEIPDNQEFRILRDAHPKGHQCLQGEIQVLENDLFADGLLGKEATFPALLRVSSSSATPESDDVNDVRGLAVKIDPQGLNHDLVMLSSNIFPTNNAKQFTSLVKVARVAGCMEGIADIFSCVSKAKLGIRDIPAIISAAGLFNSLQENSAIESPFEKSFFGVSSYRYEDGTVFKYELSPCQPGSYSLADGEIDTATGKANLENHIRRVLDDSEVCYNVNLVKLPDSLDPEKAIETHTKTWDELAGETLPRIPVAIVKVGSQEHQEVSALECDNMSFNPTNLSQGFEGLGSLNRARKEIYRVLSDFRIQANDTLRK